MRRAFITGATGFIGGRPAEVRHQRHVPVTAVGRPRSRAARMARRGWRGAVFTTGAYGCPASLPASPVGYGSGRGENSAAETNHC